jgi:hypothetical protein
MPAAEAAAVVEAAPTPAVAEAVPTVAAEAAAAATEAAEAASGFGGAAAAAAAAEAIGAGGPAMVGPGAIDIARVATMERLDPDNHSCFTLCASVWRTSVTDGDGTCGRRLLPGPRQV